MERFGFTVTKVNKDGTPKKTAPSGFPDFETFKEGLGTWKKVLSSFTSSKKFADIYTFVKEKYEDKALKNYPPPNLIFNAFKTCELSNIKVCILGQDPYHQPGQAMGLAFSVPKGGKFKFPPSLRNIYKGLDQDPGVDFTIPKHGDLTNWATQGVFLINTVLTVTESKANSHKKGGWLKFADHVIKAISDNCDDVVFLLWGKPSEKKAALIDTDKHCILTAAHPSPLSAFRGFFECHHFSKANAYLKSKGKDEIDWNKIND